MTVLAIAAVAVLLLLGWLFTSFNRFVRQRQHVQEARSDVDTEEQRRHDLIPNLVEVTRGYAAHERAVFTEVTTRRGEAVAQTRFAALAEAYPVLQADLRFADLFRELVETENRLQAARRIQNANVRDYNRRVEAFPSMVVAHLCGFERDGYLEAPDGADVVPEVALR